MAELTEYQKRVKAADQARLAKQKADREAAARTKRIPEDARYVYFNKEWIEIKTRLPLYPHLNIVTPDPKNQASPDDLNKYWPDLQYYPDNLQLDYAGEKYPGYKGAFRNDEVAWKNYVAHTLTCAVFAELALNPDSYAFEVLDYDNLSKPELPKDVPLSVKLVDKKPIGRCISMEDMLKFIPSKLQEQFKGDFVTSKLRGNTMSLRLWLYKNRNKF